MLRGFIASGILVSLCVVIHAVGLVLIGDWLIKHPSTISPKFSIRKHSQLLISVFLIIICLHLVETLVWAIFYEWRGYFVNFETSWYFSIGSYTTIGYGDVVLPPVWRILGGVEGINGVLLSGLSTAFLFAIVNQMFLKRLAHGSDKSSKDVTNDAP